MTILLGTSSAVSSTEAPRLAQHSRCSAPVQKAGRTHAMPTLENHYLMGISETPTLDNHYLASTSKTPLKRNTIATRKGPVQSWTCVGVCLPPSARRPCSSTNHTRLRSSCLEEHRTFSPESALLDFLRMRHRRLRNATPSNRPRVWGANVGPSKRTHTVDALRAPNPKPQTLNSNLKL